MMEPIIVAAIAAIGTLGAAWVQFGRLRRENRDQHAAGYTLLSSIHDDVGELRKGHDRIETKLDRHLGWHAGRGEDPDAQQETA